MCANPIGPSQNGLTQQPPLKNPPFTSGPLVPNTGPLLFHAEPESFGIERPGLPPFELGKGAEVAPETSASR
jgi:hypothetical protein